ncbi:MAG: PmbA protein [Gammaproteobacteria bacterium]|nr:MAG: PmbA protein [Gammaproteobacteria bacterium]
MTRTPTSLLDPVPLHSAVQFALEQARQQGATSAEAAASQGQGLSLNVRMGEIETIEHTRDRGLVVTVYLGPKMGSASTADYGSASVAEIVEAACNIARHIEDDVCNGLPDADDLATTFPDLDLYHPWRPTVDDVLDEALACEQAALDWDQQIENSEGASVSTHETLGVYGNSLEFLAENRKTRHGISCLVIGRGEGGMQRDYWYTSARRYEDLEAAAAVGKKAAQRAVQRLSSRRVPTDQVPVLFEAPVAASLLSHLVSAISGSALYRKASFLLDQLEQPVFPDWVRVHEQPLLPRAIGSAAFDGEGVQTRTRDIVSDGILTGYVLDSYSARRLGLRTTGNAGGVHNLTLGSGRKSLDELVSDMGRGLLVTELIGFGVNAVTGDYSRGAAGFWVDQGEIQFPVDEITIAGNLKQMFKNFSDVGTDVDTRGNVRCGSILINEMTVAGD